MVVERVTESYFAGRVAIVTGAASGIGEALARELASWGSQVVLADIEVEKLNGVAGEIERSGGKALALQVDVCQLEQVQELRERVYRSCRRIDFVFNNAGISRGGEALDLGEEDYKRCLQVNLGGVINGVLTFYPFMVKQKSGHLVNTSSIGGLVPVPFALPYITTKHAITGLTLSLRAEAKGYGVKVNLVCPGVVDTPIYEKMDYPGYNREKILKVLPVWKMSPIRCARRILRGVKRNQAVIVVGIDAWILWGVYRFSPRLSVELGNWAMGWLRRKGR